jgi:predicted transcriptional regulator
MPDPATRAGRGMTGDMLIAAFFEGRPPRRTKLALSIWHQAANVFVAQQGRLKLRVICEECGVSYRTAWRIREMLRDAAQVIREQDARSSRTHHVSKEYRNADRSRPQIAV